VTHLVRPARPQDLAALPGIEEAADAVFAEHGIGPLPPGVADVDELGRAAYVLVFGDPVVGFARLERVDGQAHLEQLSVHPASAGCGVGTALLEASVEWAARNGHEALTLCTFSDVPWNAPFYARHGFVEVGVLGPGLRALRNTESRLGLDALGRRVVLRREVGPAAVLSDLAAGLTAALGSDLLGLYAHGSLVSGDFAPARSDLDVLAVVTRPPDDAMLGSVAPTHAAIEQRHPAWRGRIEVETVARSTVAAYAVGPPSGQDGSGADAIMRISPGEALHLLPATRHRVVTWATVREKGRALVGPAAAEVLPTFSERASRDALLDHVRDWPAWVEGMRTTGAQSYAVLSMCRAWCAAVDGLQLSKRAAADRLAAQRPKDSDLVTWARDWWYSEGSDEDEGRFEDVRYFVARTSRDILDRAEPLGP